jgi:hypothetical protein
MITLYRMNIEVSCCLHAPSSHALQSLFVIICSGERNDPTGQRTIVDILVRLAELSIRPERGEDYLQNIRVSEDFLGRPTKLLNRREKVRLVHQMERRIDGRNLRRPSPGHNQRIGRKVSIRTQPSGDLEAQDCAQAMAEKGEGPVQEWQEGWPEFGHQMWNTRE